MSLKKEIIDVLEEIASLLEFKGANKFKIRAYKNGASSLRNLSGNFEKMISDGSIQNVKGIGQGLLKVINDYYSHKESSELEELKNSIPQGLDTLFQIKGLGAKKIKSLFEDLNISNLDLLEQACKNNMLSKIKGFSQKSQNNILLEIERIKSNANFILLPHAMKRAAELISTLNSFDELIKIEMTGELRRHNEIISEIELILLTKNYNQLLVSIDNLFDYKELGDDLSYHLLKITTPDSKIIKFHITETEKSYDRYLFLTTGSREFISKLEIGEQYLGDNSAFDYLKLPYVAPPMREIQYFDAPEKLRKKSNFSFNDFKGLLHFHTITSDGLNTLHEMANKAQDLGFEYSGVCDHSKSAFYANGLSEKEVRAQCKEIINLNSKHNFRIFQGIESDILNSGSLDYNDDIMKNFDFVVASVHSNFSMSEEDMTKRVIQAIESPFTDILGHPTGRLLLRRNGYAINIRKVIDACSANDVAIEINASPFRLDLDWRYIYYAREKGIKFAINPDAHSTENIENIKYGIMTAQKAGLQKEELINCYTLNEFLSFINRKVKRIMEA